MVDLMREFMKSDQVCIHPSSSCELAAFFSTFDIFCKDRGVRPFKTVWKEIWNEFGVHLARRRGAKRLLGVQISPSSETMMATDSQDLAYMRASLDTDAVYVSEEQRLNKFPF